MKVDLFDFDLPSDNIAQHPAYPRDSARMLDLSDGNIIKDSVVNQLIDILRVGDLLICNDTKVIPTRLSGKRGLATVEITLHKAIDDNSWQAFAKPAKKLNIGDKFIINDNFHAIITDKLPTGEVIVEFNLSADKLRYALWQYAIMPLPPYIKRTKGGDITEEDKDRQDYQTMFAKTEGAVAAPTAGLHFTNKMQQNLINKGIDFQAITLHVGAGTFLPIKVDDTDNHIMHHEWGEITKTQAKRINNAHAKGGRIIAIGTTSLRLLETAANMLNDDNRINHSDIIAPFSGDTDIFITPGYKFKAVDMLLTNFHLPKSTLFMLICAFSGIKSMQRAYKYAINSGYRFYSFGDCCLLKRKDNENNDK